MTNIKNFVAEKTFESGSRIFSGKMVKYLLRKDLIWSMYDDETVKNEWLMSLRDDRMYIVDKRVNDYDETDYWFQITRMYRMDRPAERAEFKALHEKLRRERENNRSHNPRPPRVKS